MTYLDDSAGCAGALARLGAIGFHEAGVRERLGLEDLDALQMKALPIYRRERLAAREPLDLAIELFVLQGALGAEEAARLFSAEDREALAQAGVLEARGDAVRARMSIYPVGGRLIFSDHAWPQLDTAGFSTVPHDQVMYVGTDSRWLARATVRKPVEAALDLCTGSGIHALLAASHAGTALAVDINPRAVACTRFNARALGLANVEVLQGDLYAPVAGRRFGLITANPPFVPAPAQEVGFRDGGPSGEDVQRRIVEGLPLHLAPGGMAQIVTELGESDGMPLEARLRTWLGGAAMDIHVLRLRIHPAQTYAIGHADGDDPAAFLASVDRWHANLQAQGYTRVVSVLLAFRWSGDPFTRVDEAHAPTRDAGAEVAAILDAEALFRDPSLRDRLKAWRVARTGPVALLEAHALGSKAEPVITARLAGQAMPVEHTLGALERELLACLEAPVRVADLLAAGAGTGIPEAAVLDALASLVRKGFAAPAP